MIYVLQMKCVLENISCVKPCLESCKISVKHPKDDSQIRDDVILSLSNDVEMAVNHGEGVSNVAFNMSWEKGTKPASCVNLTLAEVKKALPKKCKNSADYLFRELTEEDSGQFVPILACDFKGDMEPNGFQPADSEEFNVTTVGGKVFKSEDVDFSDDWCEYDDENDEAVSVQVRTLVRSKCWSHPKTQRCLEFLDYFVCKSLFAGKLSG